MTDKNIPQPPFRDALSIEQREPTGQLDPTGDRVLYRFLDIYRNPLAEVIISNYRSDIADDFEPGNEYWKIHGNGFNSDRFKKILVQRITFDMPTLKTTRPGSAIGEAQAGFRKQHASFWCPLTPRWTQPTSDVNELGQYHKLAKDFSGFRAHITWSADKNCWTGTLDWMKPSNIAYVFTMATEEVLEGRAMANLQMNRYKFVLADLNTIPRPT